MAATALTSCNGNMVYDKYDHTPLAGWEKNDTLSFDIPRLTADGMYESSLGLRITDNYPFMGLTLIVEQRLMPADTIMLDTVKCELTDKTARQKAKE